MAKTNSATNRRDLFAESLHLLVLSGLAVAQPIFDLLARHPGFFIVRRSQPVDLLILAGTLSLLLPASLAGILAAWRRDRPEPATLAHRLMIALLTTAIALQALKRLPGLPAVAAVALAFTLGAVVAVAYDRYTNGRLFLSLLSPTILVFPLVFLLHPSISKILWPRHVAVISEQAAEVRSETPVFLIVFDALPTTSLMNDVGEVDAGRFPNIARLAAGATWYRNATTVSRSTVDAIPAILTGNYPDVDLLPSFYDHPRNLFTLLGSSYDLELFEHIAELCPAELCPRDVRPLGDRLRALASDLSVVFLHLLLPDEMAASLPPISHTWADFAMDANTPDKRDRNLKVSLFLDAIDPQKPRTLYFLHTLFPHRPFQYLPSGTRYTRVKRGLDRQGQDRGQWSADDWAVLQSYRRHLLQVGRVDALLGSFLDRLSEADLLDRSLIVVTADHGVSFRAGDSNRGLTETNYLDIMPVPLFVKRPGQTAGGIDDRNVETIDILPSIADILEVELPWSTDGVSFESSVGERPTKVCYTEERLEFPLRAFDAKLDAARRITRVFGSGDLASVLAAGPHRDLIGQELTALPRVEDPGAITAHLADPSLFREVAPASGFVPALIEGFIVAPRDLEPPLTLAVAVNGIVQATTHTFFESPRPGQLAFSALAAEKAFRAGTNEIEVFLVHEAEAGRWLERTVLR